MTDKEPTQEQIKELCEWCGFCQLPKGNKGYHYEATVKVMNWKYPDGFTKPFLPTLDLDNLFKYAVPKLHGVQLTYPSILFTKPTYEAEVWVDRKTKEPITTYNQNPALALFWAIWEAVLVCSSSLDTLG